MFAPLASRTFRNSPWHLGQGNLLTILFHHHHHSSLGSRCVLWLGEGLSMSSPNDPVLCCPLPYRVALVFVQVVSPPLGWSPLSFFPIIWSPSGDARGPSVVCEAVSILFSSNNLTCSSTKSRLSVTHGSHQRTSLRLGPKDITIIVIRVI